MEKETLRILVVDDDSDVGSFIKMKLPLDAPHFSIEVAEGGQACLEYLDSHAVDCILSDYQMPGMDGMELLTRLREQGNEVPVIFVTGQGNEELASKAFRNGASDYFTKDIGFAHFARIINSVEKAVMRRRAEEDKARAEDALRLRLEQQRAVADLGRFALSSHSPDDVMEEAVVLVARGLHVELSMVMEIQPGEDSLLLRAGVGWKEGLVGSATVDACEGTLPDYTLKTCEPVIVEDLWADRRFTAPRLLLEHGAVSGISVIIGTPEAPFGILGAHSKERLSLGEHDISFVQSVANILSEVNSRNKAEKAIFESEARYRALFDASADGILIADIDTRKFMFANPAICQMFGYTEDDLLTLGVADIHPKDALPHVIAEFGSQARGEKILSPELPCLGKDGTVFYADVSTVKTVIDGRECNLGLFRDVTARKAAEEALLFEKMRLDGILACIGDGISIQDTNMVIEYQNQAMKDLIGDHVGEHCYKAYEKNSDVCGGCPMVLSMEDGQIHVSERSAEVHGKVLYAEIKTAPLRDPNGKIYGCVESVRDVTERKAAEDALRMANDVVENSPTVLFRWKAEEGWPVEFVSANISQFGYSPEELTSGRVSYASTIHPEDLPQVAEEVSRHMSEGPDHFSQEYRILTKGGDVRWVDDRTVVERDAEGNAIYYKGIVLDITERKAAEAALWESESKFRNMVENSLVGVYIIQDGRFAYANPKLAEIFGYSQDEMIKGRLVDDLVAPDSRPVVLENIRRRVSGEVENINYQFAGFRADRTEIDVEVFGSLTSYNGKPAVIGTLIDITKRKRAEERIAQLNRLYSALSQTSQTVVKAEGRGELLEQVCRIVVDTAGFRMAWAGLADMSTGMVVPEASAGFVDGYLDGIRISTEDVPEGRGPTGTAIRTGEHFISTDIETDPRMAPWRERALGRGYLACAAFPLIKGEHAVGALNVYSEKPQFSDPEEVALLDDLAAEVSYALQHLDEEDMRRQAEEALLERNERLTMLNRIDKAMTSTPELEEVQGVLMEELGKAVGMEAGVFYIYDTGEAAPTVAKCYNFGKQDETRCLSLSGIPEVEEAVRDRAAKVVSRVDKGSEVYVAFGIKSYMLLPLEKQGVLQGIIFLFNVDEPHDFNEGEVEFAMQVADQAVIAIMNANLVNSLRENEKSLTVKNNALSALNAVAEVISSSRDLEEMLQSVLDTTLSIGFLDVQSKGVIFLRDVNDPSALNMAAQKGLAPELVAAESRIEMGHCLCGKSAQTGEIIRSGDCFADPGHTAHYPAMQRHGHIVLPIKSKEEVLGVMTFYLEPDTEVTSPQERLLSAIAGQLAVAIDNKRLFENIAAGKKEWEETFDAIEEAVTIHGPDHTVLRANNAAAELAGMSVDEIVGSRCYEIFHDQESPISNCPAKDMIAGVIASRTEEVIINGRPFEVSVYPVMDDGAMTAFVHIAKDVTERREYEKSLKEHTANAMMAAEVGESLATGFNMRKMLQGCAEAVVRHLGAALVRIWTLDKPEGRLDLQASAGMYTHIDGAHSRIPVDERTNIGTIACTHQPHLTNSVIGDPMITDQEWAKREGMVAFAGYPLIVQGRLVGVMAMFATRELGEDILKTLSSVANEVAVGIERQMSTESLQSANELLGALSQIQTRFITDADPKELFDTLLSELLSLTQSEYGFIGGILHTGEGEPYLKTYAITNIAWNDETRKLYDEYASQGLEFHNLNTLFGAAMTSGDTVLSNDPATDPRSGGLPEGHPPLNAFLGLPIYSGDEMVGMAGVANRPGGYSDETVSYLQPYIVACANIIEAHRNMQLRKRAESALRDSEEKFRNLVEQSLVGVYIIQDNLFKYVNPRFAEIFGYAPEEIINVKSPRDLVLSDDWPRVGENLARRESGKTDTLDNSFRGVTRQGKVVHVEIHGSSTVYEGRAAALGVLMDVTERLLAQEEIIKSTQQMAMLRQAGAQLEEVNRLKSEFLASMSHELRTPLNAVIGLSQVLVDGTYGPLTDKQSEYLTGISESGKHLLSLINDILDLSKIEAGKERLEYSVFNMADMLRKSFMMVREKALKHRIELEQEIDTGIGGFYADERRVKQIIFNLLSNAVKFTEPGGRVGLKAAQDEKALTVTVWDTGIGIPDDKKHLLFKPFQMVDSSLSRGRGGTGLGLVLTRKLTEMHGGTISFESKTGEGTSFKVTLPVKKPGRPDSGGLEAAPKETWPEGPGSGAGKKVMVVEDNHLNMLLVADYLKNSGFEVIEATNGEIAIEKTSREMPDIILMDIQMPGIDGFEALTRLKENPATSGIPVIAMTALAMKGDEQRCMEAGFNDYLSKPVDLKAMLLKIRAHMNNRDLNG